MKRPTSTTGSPRRANQASARSRSLWVNRTYFPTLSTRAGRRSGRWRIRPPSQDLTEMATMTTTAARAASLPCTGRWQDAPGDQGELGAHRQAHGRNEARARRSRPYPADLRTPPHLPRFRRRNGVIAGTSDDATRRHPRVPGYGRVRARPLVHRGWIGAPGLTLAAAGMPDRRSGWLAPPGRPERKRCSSSNTTSRHTARSSWSP